ncbi:ion transporter [Sulfurimonas xiamenensis]|jgi:voltage-gated sodium channel|uniref:Ion transporter n=1 Tax=Sulfurimonas xiamenensis TaxID=2590021 RepID=A0AAJ4A4Z2_9BACT|nr:ion transporter [Sulfurimonas xiamenensis]QFR43947.1 ion transporter [Sulfurimonas xiamenensis]
MYSKIKSVVESKSFVNFITYLIILNGITMGLETSKEFVASFGLFASLFNTFVISIFTIEIVLRIYVNRISFFKDPWSLFDFTIVAISLVPLSAGFEILRVLRVLRLFRLVTVVPQMRKIVSALISVIPGMLSIAALMSLFFYIFAIMATQLYSEKFPQWFGTLGESFYTLFQIMTLESWSMGIVRPIMEVYPLAWIFFVPFIFVVTFVMINLIVAIVVDAMSIINKEEEEHIVEEVHVAENHTNSELAMLREEIAELKSLLKANIKS